VGFVCMILLEPVGFGFTKFCTGMARGQYLALSKAKHVNILAYCCDSRKQP